MIDSRVNRLGKLAEVQQQEQKKLADLVQQRFDRLEKMLADITRRLPQDTDLEEEDPTPEGDTANAMDSQPDGVADQSDTDSWDIKWSDTDDESDDDKDAGGDGHAVHVRV